MACSGFDIAANNGSPVSGRLIALLARSTETHGLRSTASRDFVMRAKEAVGSSRAEIMRKATERDDNTLEIGCIASTYARLLCRGVDTDENEIGLLDRSVYIG